MSKGASILAATKAVDVADRAMVTKHRMRLRATYRAALAEILGPLYEDIDLRCEDLLDSMVQNMQDRAGTQAPASPGFAAVEEALSKMKGNNDE
jgi:hypothetical protein